MSENQSSARKGKATEQLVAASCIIASGSQLNALTGVVDDEGVDITFKRRDSSQTLDVQVKSRFIESSKGLREDNTFMTNTRRATFRARDDLYFLFVIVDGKKATFGPVWFVPSRDLEELANEVTIKGKKALRFRAGIKKGSDNKWKAYRLEREELTPKVLAVIRSLGRRR